MILKKTKTACVLNQNRIWSSLLLYYVNAITCGEYFLIIVVFVQCVHDDAIM